MTSRARGQLADIVSANCDGLAAAEQPGFHRAGLVSEDREGPLTTTTTHAGHRSPARPVTAHRSPGSGTARAATLAISSPPVGGSASLLLRFRASLSVTCLPAYRPKWCGFRSKSSALAS